MALSNRSRQQGHRERAKKAIPNARAAKLAIIEPDGGEVLDLIRAHFLAGVERAYARLSKKEGDAADALATTAYDEARRIAVCWANILDWAEAAGERAFSMRFQSTAAEWFKSLRSQIPDSPRTNPRRRARVNKSISS